MEQGLAEDEVQPLRPARSAVPASASQEGCRCPGSGGGGGEGDRQWVCRPETGLTGPGDQEGAVVRGASGLGPEGCVLGCTQGWEEGAGPADAIECPQGRGTAGQAPTNSLSLLFPF